MKPEERKKRLEKLVERYYGKLALLEAWEKDPDADPDYIRDLKKRIRTHKNELTYKGADTDAGDLSL
jgi:hypothetical protein